ncbi:protein odr-4 homolog [Clonorchis sinensis]|uniref:Protein odr-4 homolog n=1 Tax=Clonorchis sinensis TaxID=79923 RepID=G7YVE6_CLOSI|nr:protein odr-4 homolog [Clonorchis sinensis]
MIKSALYEPSFSDRFVGLTGFHCGVVLSGTLGHDEHLFLPIELPPKEDTERGRSEIKPLRCIRDIDEKWVASHCRNLNRMIPGGIRISGICLTSTLSEFNSEQEHLKRILFNLPKTDPMIGEITGARENEKLVLLCDPQSKKFTCKILDVGSSVSIFRSATVKPQMFIHSYRTFRTTISLSVETILPADRQKEEILLQLQAAVKPYLQSLLRESNLLINGEFRDSIDYVLADVGEKAMVDVLSSSKQRKRSSKVSKRRSFGAEKTSDYGESGDFGTETYLEREPSDPGSDKGCWADVELTIFGPQFPRWKRASSSSSLESGTSSDTGYTGGTDRTDSSGSGLVPINRLIVNGCIPGIAFLPSDTTVGTLFEVIHPCKSMFCFDTGNPTKVPGRKSWLAGQGLLGDDSLVRLVINVTFSHFITPANVFNALSSNYVQRPDMPLRLPLRITYCQLYWLPRISAISVTSVRFSYDDQ